MKDWSVSCSQVKTPLYQQTDRFPTERHSSPWSDKLDKLDKKLRTETQVRQPVRNGAALLLGALSAYSPNEELWVGNEIVGNEMKSLL